MSQNKTLLFSNPGQQLAEARRLHKDQNHTGGFLATVELSEKSVAEEKSRQPRNKWKLNETPLKNHWIKGKSQQNG